MQKRIALRSPASLCLFLLVALVCRNSTGPTRTTSEDFYPLGYGHARVYNHYDSLGDLCGYDSVEIIDTCRIRGYPGYVQVEKVQTGTDYYCDTVFLMAYPNRIEFIADTGAVGYNYDTLTNARAIYFRHTYDADTFSVPSGGNTRMALSIVRKPTCTCDLGVFENCIRMVYTGGGDTMNIWEFADVIGLVNAWENNKLEMSLVAKDYATTP